MMMTLGHDLVEDTSVTLQELKEKFGADVAAHIGILTKKSAKEIAIEKMDYNKSEHYEDPTLPVYVKSVPAVTAHQKEGLFAYITQRKEAKNKLHPRKSIDANLINSYEDLYADLKNIARDIYFERLKKFSEEDIIYYSFSTLLPFSEEEKYVFSDDFGVLDMQEVLMTKCEDVINNLGTMQDDVLGGNRDKIIRKITEAKDHVLPLAKEYCPEYLPALMHWIAYGEAAVEKLKG